jgi:hypothetical protein
VVARSHPHSDAFAELELPQNSTNQSQIEKRLKMIAKGSCCPVNADTQQQIATL